MPYKPYVPEDIGELLDHLAHMLFAAPKFNTRLLPRENIDTTFFSLNEGLLAVRKKLGEERYMALRAMSDKLRALFEADPEDKNGDTQAGREIIHEMDDILKNIAKR